MIIATFVRKETEVGIMIVRPHLYIVDMEMVNQFIHISSESIKVGNTTERLNGSNNGSMV